MKILILSLIVIICVLKIESVLGADIAENIKKVYDTLIADIESARVSVAMAETAWIKSNSVADKDVFDKATAYEKKLEEAKPAVERYRKHIEQTGKGDPLKYKDVKSALNNIFTAKTEYENVSGTGSGTGSRIGNGIGSGTGPGTGSGTGHGTGSGKPWYRKKKVVVGAKIVGGLVAVGSVLYGIGSALGWLGGGGDTTAQPQFPPDLIPSNAPFGSKPVPKFPYTNAPNQSSPDTVHIIIWTVSIGLMLCALLFGGWILWNRYYRNGGGGDEEELLDRRNHRSRRNSRNRSRKQSRTSRRGSKARGSRRASPSGTST